MIKNINRQIIFTSLLLAIVFLMLKVSSIQAVNKQTITGDATESSIPLTQDSIYSITGNLTISNNIPGNKTGVIFVDGNLLINPDNKKLTYNQENAGLVFVVKGNVNIGKDVEQIDAVIISEGIICTAYDGTSCLDGTIITPQLVINGSLVCLSNCQMKFGRRLGETGILKDSTDPAEKINHQIKYLVILRDLMSDTYQKWSEIP